MSTTRSSRRGQPQAAAQAANVEMLDEESKHAKSGNSKNSEDPPIPCSQASLREEIEREEQREREKIQERVE